ncbi:PITPNM2 [Bugula neritina]|uniref:PITPNM2 n=1 Tax=Bugula neritina TaxID=10212 RepID=A0A7J7JGL1_BUGNE|nr:PITPNM2 [Bugula neritina]
MHVKEYRIPLPLTVEEYRIAQLYMIQKKSREESSGAGSGVEIIKNEPYEDGPGGCGQYTYKIYHIGSHLPNWFRAILPKSALRVEEEAWNAYPYTKTIFRCPFIEKFSITIETVYKPDGGTQENVFGLGQRELKTRLVDLLDFVKDSLPSGDYKKEEDPKLYVSSATGRGPLTNDWLKERMVHGASGGPVMCAYKLCYVEFRYWGMQSKIERFIHDTALRKTMVRAHRQAWAWQDEWHGLTIDDIRDLEMQTQQALAQKMEHAVEDSPQQHPFSEIHSDTADSSTTLDSSANNNSSPDDAAYSAFRRVHSDTPSANPVLESPSQLSRISWSSLEKVNEDSDDEEFFDAQDEFENGSDRSEDAVANSLFSQNEEEETLAASNTLSVESSTSSIDGSARSSPNKIFSRQATIEDMDDVDGTSCDISVLFLVLHGGNALLVESDKNSKFSDLSTWKATFDKVVSRHYPNFLGRYSIKLVACPPMHSEALNLLASINPLSNEGSDSGSHIYNEYFPISAVPLLAVQTPEYQDCMLSVANRANKAYRDFLLSDEGNGFSGQVVLVGDCMGSVLAFDILCVAQPELSPQLEDKKKYASDTDLNELPESKDVTDFSDCMTRSAVIGRPYQRYGVKQALRLTISAGNNPPGIKHIVYFLCGNLITCPRLYVSIFHYQLHFRVTSLLSVII